MTSKPSPRLVTYSGLPVIVIDPGIAPVSPVSPASPSSSYPLYDRREILEERAAMRDAIAEAVRRPRPRLTSLALMMAAIAPSGPRRRAILDPLDEEDMYGIQRTERLLRERRIAAARAAEAPPVVRPAGEADPARAQQRDQRKQRRAKAKRRGFR